ncbi:MAG TPA: hypothetical protein VF679_09010 [Pedobacter sp.]|jgi:hypothetical protein
MRTKKQPEQSRKSLSPETLYVIGIDGGKNTAIAVYQGRKFLYKSVNGFWQQVKFILRNIPSDNATILLEQPLMNKVTFQEAESDPRNQLMSNKISRDIGRNIATAENIAEILRDEGYTVIEIRPKKSKLSAKELKDLLLMKQRSNEHERDAMMLCERYFLECDGIKVKY